MEAGAGLHRNGRRRVNVAQVAVVLVGAVLVGVGVGVGSHFLLAKGSPSSNARPASGELHGQARWPAGAQPAPAISRLRDQSNGRFSLASLRGRTVAMVFFDSHCTQACPLAGRALAAAERSLPRAQRPVLVVVSINPLDTPASTRIAARKWGLAGAGPWRWLRGSHAELASVWRSYHIFVQPERGDISHTEALYLIDRHGDERSGFLYPYLPGVVARDLRTLASSRGAGRA